MVAIYKAPELCQGADEDLIVQIGGTIFPGFVGRISGENGLSLNLDGDYNDSSLVRVASDKFQILLGALRAWNAIAGQRKDEVRPGIGSAPIMNERGDQIVMAGSAIWYRTSESDREPFAQKVKLALSNSQGLKNSPWLNGRRDSNAADFYMIFEYAEKEFSGRQKIVEVLNISDNNLSRLTMSANRQRDTPVTFFSRWGSR